MSEFRKFQEIKVEYEARMAAELRDVIKDFQVATGAPVYAIDVDLLDTRSLSGVSQQVVAHVTIRTEG